MPRDRLADLQNIRAQSRMDINADDGPSGAGDNNNLHSYEDTAVIQMDPEEERIRAFLLKEVDDCRRLLPQLQEHVGKVRELQRKVLFSPFIPDDRHKQEEELDDLNCRIKHVAYKIRGKLSTVTRHLVHEESKQTGVVSADLSLRKTELLALTRTHIATLMDYQAAQSDYRDIRKCRSTRPTKIGQTQYSDQEIETLRRIYPGFFGSEQMMEDVNCAEADVFTQGIIQATSEQDPQRLADIEVRRDSNNTKLEEFCREHEELCLETQVLFESQGRVMDGVETQQVSRAQDAWGRKRLRQAARLHSSARRIIEIILFLIIPLVFLIIWLTW